MTDWKEEARKHEDSANHYARRCHDLEAINAELAEALRVTRNRLWTRRFKFNDADHNAMNKASEALKKARTP